MKSVIAGGSLAGLMAGLELRAAGLPVSIHERSERVLDDRGAGIVMQPETQQVLIKRCGLRQEETGVWLQYRQYLGKDGTLEFHKAMPQLMTSWGLLYRAMRAAFLAEDYVEGDALLSFKSTKRKVTCHFAKSGEVECDLLETFADHFTFQQMRRSHILCYLIPGANGETEPGARRLNWVWYWNVAEAALPDFMTGRDARVRDFSVPPGQMREELVEQQGAIAEEMFCPQFFHLWKATKDPFAQPILDLAVPRMRHERIAVVGDAAFIPRPHTAASTSKAAANAIALGEALVRRRLDIDAALKEWEPRQLDLGRRLEAQGIMLGNRSQFSD